MHTKFLRIAATLVVASACAAVAPAANAMTIRVGDPKLTGRIAISVPVLVTCSAFDPALTQISGAVTVSVQQASGREIASGSGIVTGALFNSPVLPFACDGTEQTVLVTVLANTNGPPFHGGRAVLSATANATAGQPCFPGSTTCFFASASQTASTGQLWVRL